MKIKLTFTLLLISLPLFSLQVNNEQPEFILLLATPQHTALQVSVARYQPRTGGALTVDLVGAVHVGDLQ